jgi:hypothetical protein
MRRGRAGGEDGIKTDGRDQPSRRGGDLVEPSIEGRRTIAVVTAVDRIVSGVVNRIRPQSGDGSSVPTAVLVGWYLRKGAVPVVRGALRSPLLGAVQQPFFR